MPGREAEAGLELYASWLDAEHHGHDVPFGQIHGHSSAYDWASRQWRTIGAVPRRFHPNRRDRHLTGIIGGQYFTGIDPDHGRQPAPQLGAAAVRRASHRPVDVEI